MSCFSDFRSTRVQRQPGGGGFPGPQNCVGECVFNKVKVWNNGDIDLDAAQRYFTTGLANTPEWIPIVSEGFKKCSQEAKTIIAAAGNRAGDCSPVPALTLACLHTHVITKCPANLWNNCNYLELVVDQKLGSNIILVLFQLPSAMS